LPGKCESQVRSHLLPVVPLAGSGLAGQPLLQPIGKGGGLLDGVEVVGPLDPLELTVWQLRGKGLADQREQRAGRRSQHHAGGQGQGGKTCWRPVGAFALAQLLGQAGGLYPFTSPLLTECDDSLLIHLWGLMDPPTLST